MRTLDVSVVMAVYNEQTQLAETIASILSQQSVEFEFIIVNDGSTDNSLEIIQGIAHSDPRVHVINQENSGLTKALILGCGKAKGRYIARQDAGDISLPGRLAAQLDVLNTNDGLSMVSAGTSFIGPNAEEVYRVVQSPEEAHLGLQPEKIELMYGPPHHGSVMFRRSAYEQVGGYRENFSVAQDLDLWSRLAEVGNHTSLGAVYYQAGLYPDSISSSKREQQILAKNLIIEMSRVRRNGGSDQTLLSQVEQSIFAKRVETKANHVRSDFYYFLAANLSHTKRQLSKQYFRTAIRENPLNLKAWIRIALLSFSK